MAADLSLLTPKFRSKVEILLDQCSQGSFHLVPFYTLRTPEEQARLWRQSRTIAEIEMLIDKLEQEGAPYLARVVRGVGPQHGKWATNFVPGQSWHQWGEAIDCFIVGENGKAVWSAKHPGYEFYARAAKSLGLDPGFNWQRQDAGHVQRLAHGVRSLYTWPQIDDLMYRQFSKGA